MHEELSPAASLAWGRALAPIIEINERMLERLHQAARSSAGAQARAGQGDPPPLVAQLHTEWCALDAGARQRLAQCPYLLLDAGFGEPSRWQPVGTLAVHEAGPAPLEWQRFLADEAWVALVRRTLLLGWHLARAHPLAARVLLGMSPATAECIAGSRLTDLDELAERGPGRVAPRWERQPRVWRQLLRASHAPTRELLWAQLRGLQLLASEGSCAAWEPKPGPL